jgi:hypothetical protein
MSRPKGLNNICTRIRQVLSCVLSCPCNYKVHFHDTPYCNLFSISFCLTTGLITKTMMKMMMMTAETEKWRQRDPKEGGEEGGTMTTTTTLRSTRKTQTQGTCGSNMAQRFQEYLTYFKYSTALYNYYAK